MNLYVYESKQIGNNNTRDSHNTTNIIEQRVENTMFEIFVHKHIKTIEIQKKKVEGKLKESKIEATKIEK